MKNFIFITLMILPLVSWGQSILIRSAGTSEASFKEFLLKHPQSLEFMVYQTSRVQNNSDQETRLFKLGDSFLQNPSMTLNQIKSLQTEAPLTLLSLRFIRDLSWKALIREIPTQERREWLYLYCKSRTLLKEGPELFACPTEIASLSALKKKYPVIEKVLVESFTWELHENSEVVISKQTPYQWTLLSNAHHPISFFGTYEQLLNQQLVFENLVEGSCDGFSLRNLDFELTARGLFYFSDSCTRRAPPSPEKSSWMSDKKTWMYVAGAVLAGGLLYSMKDKTLVIDTNPLK
ncbi:hypothetical protein [Bdellovibrio sp.]|uniref:hypothetical protein n=1 Tax=Bdellovibrio sp. TaxID=28201 RepID=UPI0039E53778